MNGIIHYQMNRHGGAGHAPGICRAYTPESGSQGRAVFSDLFDASLYDWGRLRLAPLLSIFSSRRAIPLSPCARRLAVPRTLAAGRQFHLNSKLLGHFRQDVSKGPHHHFHNVLSRVRIPVGFDANGNSLTHAKNKFAFGANPYD